MMRLAAVCLLVLALASPALAQEYRFATDASAPMDIRADQLIVYYDASYAEYRGGVHAVQGPLEMRAQKLRIDFADDNSTVSHWSAEEDIRLTSEGKTATGQWLRYDAAEEEMHMGDEVRLSDAELQLTGQLFVLNMATSRARLEAQGEDGRARARFRVPPESR